jgi:hypothetical protein
MKCRVVASFSILSRCAFSCSALADSDCSSAMNCSPKHKAAVVRLLHEDRSAQTTGNNEKEAVVRVDGRTEEKRFISPITSSNLPAPNSILW